MISVHRLIKSVPDSPCRILLFFTMTERIEQRHCIKFCQKLGDSQAETIRKIQLAFGEDAMGPTAIKEWYNRFQNGRTSSESDSRSGRPSTSRNDAMSLQIQSLVEEDRRITVREIAEAMDISTGSTHSILREDLALRRIAAKFVPRLLTNEQKQLRLEVSQDMLDSVAKDSGFMDTIITGDESWVYGYDPETKAQSSQWLHSTSPRPKKVRQVRSKVKVMLTVFFDSQGVVHHEYAPPNQTITKEYYLEVLRHLRDAVRRKRPNLWKSGMWKLHQDNAPAHSSQLVQTFLAKHSIPVVRQAPYSPDMAPCDFWLFPKLKMPLKGTRFESRDDIMRNTTMELNSIPKEAFKRCFQQWYDRWDKCVDSQGDYFEGD